MITLNQKQLKKVMDFSSIAGRLDELKRLEGYVPSSTISRRKNILKKQLAEMMGKEETKEESTVNIRIEIPEEKKVEKKEKSFSLNLKNLLSGNFKEIEEEDDNDVLVAIKSILPKEDREVLGTIVKEL
jgi:hypothetical protein